MIDPNFSGINPDNLQHTINNLVSGSKTLHGGKATYMSRFQNLGLDTSHLAEMERIATWVDDQLPMLRRRHTLAVAMESDGDTKSKHDRSTMVQIPEPVISATQAQVNGKELADEFNGNISGDAKAGQKYHDLAKQLAEHKDDPDYCSAFYASLNPPGQAENIPSLLVATGSSTAAEDLKGFSEALGTAISTDNPAPGFNKVKKLYLNPAPKGDYSLGWDRAAMLRYGHFPSTFLAKATRANVLDQLAKNKNQDFRGGADKERALHLPEDTVALNLAILGNNGRAAFDAIAQMGDPDNPDLQGHLKLLMEYGHSDFDVQTALGQAIDAGAGVRGHTDANGAWNVETTAHTPYENTFAFAAIQAAGHSEVLDFDRHFKQDMGRMAASYAPEMLTGGHNVHEDVGDSSMDEPVPYDKVPGVNPGFYLSPQDTYRFMKTFADDDAMSAPFDAAMGKLQHDVLVKSAKIDHDAIAEGKQDPGSFGNAAKFFGSTQRFEYAAQLKIRGEMDESEEAFREHLKQAAVLGSELVGEPELGAAATMAWRGGMFALKEYGGGAYVESGADRAEEVKEKDLETVLQSRYTMTSTLAEGGGVRRPSQRI